MKKKSKTFFYSNFGHMYSHYIFCFVPFMVIIMCIYSDKKVFICCKCIYYYDTFLWLKMRFSFGVNVSVFIPIMLFYG